MADPPSRSVQMAVTIDRPCAEVHAFLADAVNWPRWAIVNVLSAEPAPEPGWWAIGTSDGPGEIRIHADPRTGIVDHDFRFDDVFVSVPARVVPNGRGADFIMTIQQPAELDDEAFDHQLALIESEFATLRRVLERTPDT